MGKLQWQLPESRCEPKKGVQACGRSSTFVCGVPTQFSRGKTNLGRLMPVRKVLIAKLAAKTHLWVVSAWH